MKTSYNKMLKEVFRRLKEDGVTEIAACPFCGESDLLREEGDHLVGLLLGHESITSFAVNCYTCSCRGPKVNVDDPRIGEVDAEGDEWMQEIDVRGIVLAVKDWNIRKGFYAQR